MKSGRDVALGMLAVLQKDLEDRRDRLERKQTELDTWMGRGEIGYIRGKIAEIEANIAKGEY